MLSNALLPFWDDIDGGPGDVYWEERQINGINALIVQWDNRPHFDGGGAVTFQLQLFQSGPIVARYVYPDVTIGSPLYDFGASATIGYQRNATTATQFSFNSPRLANGDVLELRPNAPAPDIDEYTIDLTGRAGKPIDVVLKGLDGTSFSGELLELLSPTGSVLATAVIDPVQSGVNVTNFDLGILGFSVPVGGPYTIRVTSTSTRGKYDIVVTDTLVFDSEPNNDLATNPLRSLDAASAALGAVSFKGPGLAFFSTRSVFDDAAPGLPVEDFEDGRVGPAGVVTCNAPLNSASNDNCFTPGKILPGIEIQDNPGPSSGGLVILGAGVIGNTSIVTGATSFAESTDLRFPNNNVFTVGMDVLINSSGAVGITIFGLGGVILGTSTVNATTTGSFWGVASEQIITRIALNSTAGDLVDNVAFGGKAGDIDQYKITLTAGEIVGLETRTMFANLATTPVNSLNPQLRLIHPDGTTVVASDQNSLDGRDARLVFRVTTTGVYTIEVSAESGSGEYIVRRFVDTIPPIANSFTRKTPSTSPTNADTLVFLATFSEAVTDVSATDFAITGTTGTFSVTQVTPSTYDITVTGGNLANLNGTVGLNFNSPTILDLFGNALPNTEPATDETYLVVNAPTVISLSPADNATAIPVGADLVVTFNLPVKKGNGFVHIVRASDGKAAQSIDIQSSAVTISGAVVTINPLADLVGLSNYYVAFENGAILDDTLLVKVGATLLSQDFELMTLVPAVTETVGLTPNGRDFTATPPTGYAVDRSQMPLGGVPEWSGWTFADKGFWQTEGGQARPNFIKGQGTVAVGDTQEWDDLPQLNNSFNSLFTTSSISLANVVANTVVLEFDSSFRPEGSVAANNQIGVLEVSYNGGTNWINLFTYDFNNTGSAATAANINEHKVVSVPNPVPSATGSMKFRYGLTGTNDGWWSIDNIKVTSNTTGLPFQGIANTDATTWNFNTAEALTLSLTVPATPISEKGGISTVTVSRNLGTTGDLIVTLTSSDSMLATVPATVTIPAGQASITFAVTAVDDLFADGLKNVFITASTIGFVSGNGIVPIADNEIGNVAITEIMFNPAGAEPKTEWIELFNRGTFTLDLGSWSFDDEDTTNWGALPAGTLLAPGNFAVVYNSFFGSISETTFRAEWNVPSEAVVVGVFWGDLNNSPSAIAGSVDENIVFRDAGNITFDQVNYDDDGTIWPAAANGPSIYVARVYDNNDDGTKWKSSVVGTNNAINPTNPAGATYNVGDIGSPGRGPAVSNTAYYKESFYTSGGTNIDAGLDPSKLVARAGAAAQALSFENVSNYTRGINGLVIDVAGLTATSLTVSDFGFRMSPQGAFDEATNPPSGWEAAPAPTAIVVTAGTATTPARVRIEWVNNAIENRWLQIRVLANAVNGVLTTQELYFGHLRGEINGALLGGVYFVQNTDLSAALPVGGAGSPGAVSSIRDVDKNGFVLNSDFIAIRQGIVGGLVLRNITIPVNGSGAALPRISSFGIGAPPVQPFDQTSMIMSSSRRSIRATKETEIGFVATGSSSVLGCIGDSINVTTAVSKPSEVVDLSEESENRVSRVQLVDDFFVDLDRQFKRKK